IDELGRKERNSKMRERALRLLKLVGLEGCEDAMPSELSGGMRQRVSLVRALLQDRPILLLDEPFGPLDVIVREELYALLRSVRDMGKTIIMVTHDFRDALAMADRILVLTEGEIVQDIAVVQGEEDVIVETIRSSLSCVRNHT
ncbi:MAG: ATP-binding cassette domain-containing protein, partial [Chlamydiae bacterium]|nr:ATP-binding cassette domain-containing protein [Chlamydiota bacterium]